MAVVVIFLTNRNEQTYVVLVGTMQMKTWPFLKNSEQGFDHKGKTSCCVAKSMSAHHSVVPLSFNAMRQVFPP